MRLIDADNLRGRVCEIFLCAEPGSAEERRLALVLGLIDSEHTITPPPNDPLTLEELREIDIAYCVPPNEWAKPTEFGLQFFGQSICLKWGEISHKYGKTWSAYRRKPEEA